MYLPLEYAKIQGALKSRLGPKGVDVVEKNLKALDLGRDGGTV